MAPLLAVQPFKALYTIYILFTSPVRAIYLYLRYLAKPAYPGWNASQSLSSAFLRLFFHYSTVTRSRHVLDNTPESAKERLLSVEPPSENLFTGVLAPNGVVKPAPVKGVWLPSPPSHIPADLKNEKIILHFPGGAFVVTFGHEFSGRPVSEIFTKHLQASRVLWAHYRLAEDEASRFPGAIQDALTFYQHVISLGFDPKNITLSGDSAGGNVVLALLRYLETARLPGLPVPGGAIVFSPWVKVTADAGSDFMQCATHRSDIINAPFLQWGAESYLPAGGKPSPEVQPYVSPIHYPFHTSVPIYIWAGAAEAFCGDIRVFADDMAGVQGNHVLFHAQENAAHDLLMNLNLFKLEDGFFKAMGEAAKFFNESG